MVLQKTVDNLKARPKHERRAAARGIAMAVVVILFVGWVIIFFKNVRETGIQIQPINIPKPSAFNTEPLTNAKEQLESGFSGMKDSLQAAQDASATTEF
ncbi:MAG: hypothetical protein Q7S01_00685 [bacterium]|nr:hypothetical protein [bacterium]